MFVRGKRERERDTQNDNKTARMIDRQEDIESVQIKKQRGLPS